MSKFIIHDHNNDGVDRRGFLNCMAWAGTGVLWTISGGVPSSRLFGQKPSGKSKGDMTFVQISDSHIGFKGEVNPTPGATLQEALDHIAKMPEQPAIESVVGKGGVIHGAEEILPVSCTRKGHIEALFLVVPILSGMIARC